LLIAFLPNFQEVLKYTLLEKYFPDTRDNLTGGGSGYITEITNEILQEGAETYRTRIQELKRRLDEDTYQEEIFVRSGIFKREVPRIYNHTCCISGLRVDATINVTMVDACHIVPFSISYDDTITNGLALCPNLHRAFDRGLIAISDDYRVVVSEGKTQVPNSKLQIPRGILTEILLAGIIGITYCNENQ
jgi:putative restriction endonuclease